MNELSKCACGSVARIVPLERHGSREQAQCCRAECPNASLSGKNRRDIIFDWNQYGRIGQGSKKETMK